MVKIFINRGSGLIFLLMLSGCGFFQKCDSMVPKILSEVVDVAALFPQSVRGIEKLIRDASYLLERNVEHVVNRASGRRNYGNTVLPIDRTQGSIEITLSILQLIIMTHPDEGMRAAAQKGSVELQHLVIEKISTNRELYLVFKEYSESPLTKDEVWSPEEARYLRESLRDWERNGLGLPNEQLAHARLLLKEIAELGTQFEVNINTDNRTVLIDKAGLEGLSSEFVGQLSVESDGRFVVPVNMSTRETILKHCAVAETREAFLLAYENRAYPQNESILKRIIALRDEFAALVGFQSYAHQNLDDSMAKSPEKVMEFLADLAQGSEKKFKAELELFTNPLPQGVSLSSDGKIKWSDIRYVAEMYRKKHLNVDHQKVREYFPVKRTIDELLSIYEHFLGIEFRQEAHAGLWHDDVRHLVVHRDGKVLGHLLLDLFPRENKYGHACMMPIIPALIDDSGVRCPALVAVIANFPCATQGNPGLLMLDEVRTFFHELGHAMHALLGTTKMSGLSAGHSKIDFVEVPSQMFEEWLSNPEVLKRISSHYITGEPLPDEMIQRICADREFDFGFFIQRQVALAQLSLKLFGPGAEKEPEEMKNAIDKEFLRDILNDGRLHMVCSFGHLVGYGPQYYSYLWSLVFAIDLFEKIKQDGIFDPEVGRKVADQLLAPGASRDPMELMKDFLGREPRADGFFKRLGV